MNGRSPILIDVPETLDGPRVQLRSVRVEYAPAIWEAIEESTEALKPWMPWAHGCAFDDIRIWAAGAESDWTLRESLQMLIFDQHSGQLLGNAGFPRLSWGVRSFEIGYWLRLSAEGRGFMREAVQLLTRLAFNDLEANRVEIHVDPRNTRSCNVALRLGFRLEGTLRNCAPDGYGYPSDRHVFALIPSDYQALEWSRSSSMGDR